MGWALTMLVAFRVSYPFVDVPQNAMVAFVADGNDARCRLLASRNIMSGLASLSVAALAVSLLIYRRDGMAWLIWAGCVSLFVCGTAWNLRGWKAGPVARAEGPARSSSTGIAVPAMLATLALMMVAATTFRTLEPYYAAYVGRSLGLPVWAAVGAMLSQPLWAATRRHGGTATVLAIAATLLLTAALMLLTPLRAAGAGTAVVGLGFGAEASGLWLILWSEMMAHAATGQATGHVGLFTCVSKFAQAAAMLLLGQVLAASPYRATLGDPWSAPSLLMTGALCVIAAVCVGAIPAFRVNRTTYDETPTTRRRVARTVRAPG